MRAKPICKGDYFLLPVHSGFSTRRVRLVRVLRPYIGNLWWVRYVAHSFDSVSNLARCRRVRMATVKRILEGHKACKWGKGFCDKPSRECTKLYSCGRIIKGKGKQ
jgi:hypothetical protein